MLMYHTELGAWERVRVTLVPPAVGLMMYAQSISNIAPDTCAAQVLPERSVKLLEPIVADEIVMLGVLVLVDAKNPETASPAPPATPELKLRVQVDMLAVQLCVRLPCAKHQVPGWASPAKAKKRRQRMTFFITRSSVGGSAAHGATRRKAVNRKMSVVRNPNTAKKTAHWAIFGAVRH